MFTFSKSGIFKKWFWKKIGVELQEMSLKAWCCTLEGISAAAGVYSYFEGAFRDALNNLYPICKI